MAYRTNPVAVFASTGNASAGVNMSIVNADGSTIAMGLHERLMLTDLTAVLAAGITAYVAPGSTSTLSTTPLIAFGGGNNNWTTSGEGTAFPHSTLPFIVASGAGSIVVGGNGYLISDGGWTTIPPWFPISSQS